MTDEGYEFQVSVLEELMAEGGLTYPEFIFMLVDLLKCHALGSANEDWDAIEVIDLKTPPEHDETIYLINRLTCGICELENYTN